MDLLLGFLTWAQDGLRPWTALLSFSGALIGVAGGIWGIRSKRASTAAKASSDETNVLVGELISLLRAGAERESTLAEAIVKKEAVTTDKIRTIATAAVEPEIQRLASLESERASRRRRADAPTRVLHYEGALSA